MTRPAGRPLGVFSRALIKAAERGPAPMAELAARSQVGYAVAKQKVAWLARAGHLAVSEETRPRMYSLPAVQEPPADPFATLGRAFWLLPPAAQSGAGFEDI